MQSPLSKISKKTKKGRASKRLCPEEEKWNKFG
jgi:hypothetical protein